MRFAVNIQISRHNQLGPRRGRAGKDAVLLPGDNGNLLRIRHAEAVVDDGGSPAGFFGGVTVRDVGGGEHDPSRDGRLAAAADYADLFALRQQDIRERKTNRAGSENNVQLVLFF